ncbi:MAG: type III-B CRISPR module-associated protein Cmr5 [Pseudomonadota bacterium]
MPTLEQLRSQTAWAMAQEGAIVAGKKYINLAKAAPALIMNNGLMQTLAFLESKGERHHQLLGGQLRRWVFQRAGGQDRDPGFDTMMQSLLKADSAHYRQATEEALLLLRWIRQFAAALGGE